MAPRTIAPADLGILRLLRIFAFLSVVLLTLLASVPARSYFTEWRSAQERYNALARQRSMPEVEVALRQIYTPALDVVDRCGSCHLAAAGVAASIPGDPLFGPHPAIPHDVRELGCTICHGGQGRATTRQAAHGDVAHWTEPLLERSRFESGCGTCHTSIPVPKAGLADRGRALVEKECFSCHRAEGRGKAGGVELSSMGLRGFRADWHTWHIEQSAAAKDGLFTSGFAPLADDEIALAEAYLRTLIGAPRFIRAKALSEARGCRGCHKINGVGGEDAPDLSDEGHRAAADLDFSHVEGQRSLPTWINAQLRDPPRVTKDSRMPNLGLSEEEADLLTDYVLSLRARPIPEAYEPKDRVRGSRLGERDFPSDGESIFGVFCSGCHAGGAGRKLGKQPAPAILDAEALAITDDAYLQKAIAEGRPGRRMAAWKKELRPQEIAALVGYIRSTEPVPPAFEAVMAAPLDEGLGRSTYAARCAPCHGDQGEGSAIAPPLAAPDNMATKSDDRIYGTLTAGVAGSAMGAFKTLDAATLRAVIAFVRALPAADARRETWAVRPGDAGRGAAVYKTHCASCHGEKGEGPEGPALAHPNFLAEMTDGQMAATIVRGRPPTAMPAFGRDKLSAQAVADVVAFIRSFAAGAN